MRSSRIALTGGIATGKSTVLTMFRKHGFSVLSADEVVAQCWADETIGSSWAIALGLDYPIDRLALRARLRDAALRSLIAEITHGDVIKRLDLAKVDIVEIPVLFESCLASRYDRIVVTQCSKELQIERLTERIGHRPGAIELIRTQLPSTVRVAFADFVVDTECSLSGVEDQVAAIAGLGTFAQVV